MRVISTFEGSSLGADKFWGVAGARSSMSASVLNAESQAKVNWPIELGDLLWGTCVLRQAMRISWCSRPQRGRGRICDGRGGLPTPRAEIGEEPRVHTAL